MDAAFFAVPAVIIVLLSSLGLLILSDWRWSISALAVQYVGVALLVASAWPAEMAAVKLIAGWIAGSVLGMAILSIPDLHAARRDDLDMPSESPESLKKELWTPGTRLPAGRIFRLMAALLVILVVWTIAPRTSGWLEPITIEHAWGGLLLISMGLLHLSFTATPFRTVLGLLTSLSGFEILYAALERSALVAGLLAAVTLGLALIGSFLILAPDLEDFE